MAITAATYHPGLTILKSAGTVEPAYGTQTLIAGGPKVVVQG